MGNKTNERLVVSDFTAECVTKLRNTKAPQNADEIYDILGLVSDIMAGEESTNPVIQEIRRIYTGFQGVIELESMGSTSQQETEQVIKQLDQNQGNQGLEARLSSLQNGNHTLVGTERSQCARLLNDLLAVLNTQVVTLRKVNETIPEDSSLMAQVLKFNEEVNNTIHYLPKRHENSKIEQDLQNFYNGDYRQFFQEVVEGNSSNTDKEADEQRIKRQKIAFKRLKTMFYHIMSTPK